MEWRSINCFGYDSASSKWLPASQGVTLEDVECSSLSLFTYNVLFDLLDEDDSQHNEERMRHVASILEQVVSGDKGACLMVCLQEVTPRVARFFLQQKFVRARLFSSCSPGETESLKPYGQLLLSSAPFHAKSLRFGKHKSVVSARLSVNGSLLGCVGLHLTSNYHQGKDDGATEVTDSVLGKRNAQLAACLAHLEDEGCETRVLMGDFNFSDEDRDQREGVLAEALERGWHDVTALSGPTFDCEQNALARKTSRRSKRKRYDRVLVRGGDWEMRSCRVLGRLPCVEGLPPSDHFGVHAVLEAQAARGPLLAFASLDAMVSSQASMVDDEERRARVVAQGRAWVERAAAERGEHIALVTTVGSTFLGVALPSADVDMVVVGSAERDAILGALAGNYVSEGVLVPILKSEVEGVPLEIQYVQLPQSTRVPTKPADLVRLANTLEPADRFPLLGVADSLCVAPHVTPAFSVCYRFLKVWATRLGIYDGACGFLSGIALSVMLARVQSEQQGEPSASRLASAFFELYATWEWVSDAVTLQGDRKNSSKDVMQVMSPATNATNICRNASLSSCARITECMMRARDILLHQGEYAWTALLLQDRGVRGRIPLFFSRHRLYVALHLAAQEEHVGYVRSKLVGCVLLMEKAGLRATVWPEALYASATSACFVIGCDGDVEPAAVQRCLDEWAQDCAVPCQAQLCEVPPAYKKAKMVSAVREEVPQEERDGDDDAPEEEAEFSIPEGRTSEQVYHRIKWDPNLAQEEFSIGYLDRFLGIIEIPFRKYHPGGKIPFHRVRLIKRRGEVVWSRGDEDEQED